MPRTLTLTFIIIFFLTACSPATALPTKPPTATPIPPTETATHTPVPTNTPTPTLEPWMASLPTPDLEVKTDENGIINAYDGEALVYSWDGSDWIEYSPYNIVRQAGKESEMSMVEMEQRADGTWKLPEELLAWERENPLPDTKPGESVDFVYYDLTHANYLQYGLMPEDWLPNQELIQPHNIYKIPLTPFGLDEVGYVYSFQYQTKDGPAFLHFLGNQQIHEQIEEIGFIGGKWEYLLFSEMIKGTFDNAYPRGDHSESYADLLRDFYKNQFGSARRVDDLIKQVAVDDVVPLELQEGLFIGVPRQQH